ncbi:hypothetical protein J0S82_015548, partial [Galemys pyrenaicus]
SPNFEYSAISTNTPFLGKHIFICSAIGYLETAVSLVNNILSGSRATVKRFSMARQTLPCRSKLQCAVGFSVGNYRVLVKWLDDRSVDTPGVL